MIQRNVEVDDVAELEWPLVGLYDSLNRKRPDMSPRRTIPWQMTSLTDMQTDLGKRR